MAPPPSKLHSTTGSALLMRLVTEDTPPDMLAGSMDLRVTLPNGNTVKMSVDRSTPMMDLLIQITTAHKVSPGDYVLQPMGDKGVLPYKPSTPIGALDTMSIKVVLRHSTSNNNQNNSLNRKRIPLINSLIGQAQPFEQTFRLQVHLPRNQLFVARLSPRTSLADILAHVCQEKNLDANKYELRHPVNTDQSLQLSLCLADYKITEIVVVPRGSRPSTELSSSDIPALQRSNGEQRNGSSSATSSGSGSGGVLSILKRNSKIDGNREGSLSGDSLGGRSSSPARSDESLSRSISPPVGNNKIMDRQNAPPPPIRHRKGRAPKPPSAPAVPAVEEESTKKAAEAKPERTALVISHSRNSSDSSGYHEASVLSDTPDNLNGHSTSPSDTINRKAAASAAPSQAQPPPGKLQYSLSMSDVSKTEAGGRLSNATSNTSLSSNKKKQKAPAPPPAAPAAADSVLMPPPPSTLPTASRSSSRSSSVLEPAARVVGVESGVPPNPPVPRARRLTPDTTSTPPPPPPVRPRRLPVVKAAILRQTSSSSLVGSVGSSSGSSIFGVGKSVLSFNVASEAGSENTYEDIDNDLDLSLFEGSSTGGSTFRRTTDILLEDDEEYANFHNSLLGERKRSSITKILNDSDRKKKSKKAPAPKAPKNIGHRRRPKLGDIDWQTEAEESERKILSPSVSVKSINSVDSVELRHSSGSGKRKSAESRSSSVFDKPSRSSSLLRKNSAEFGKPSDGEQKIVEVSSRDYMLQSQMSSNSIRSESRDEFGFLTFNPAPGDYEEIGTTSTDDLDLDLDMFAMTNAGSGDKEGTEKIPSADLPSPSEPAAVAQTQNGHSDLGSGPSEQEEVQQLEVQVQSIDVGKEDEESEYASDDEDDLDSAFQSVTDVLEKQLEAEQQQLMEEKQKIVEVVNEEELSRTPSPLEQEQERLEREAEEKEKNEKVKILKELERKRALHEKQRMEIERLQKEQEELEMALKKFEQESSQNTEEREESAPISPEPAEILNWEYKLPAPPSAFRDTKETATPSNTPEEEKRRLSFDSDSKEEVKERPKLETPLPDIIMQQPEVRIEQQEEVKEVKNIISEESELRPKPPAIVDVTPKPSVVREVPKRRSASPPKVTIVPLRAAHSLCSLVYDHEEGRQQRESEAKEAGSPPRRGSGSDSDNEKVQSPLRKTTSMDNVSKTTQLTEGVEEDEEEQQRLQQLQQQLLHWQKQLISNQSVLQEHVNMPLQSLQVLREILPQMKQKLEEDAINGTSTTSITESYTTRSSTLPRNVRSMDVDVSEPVLRSTSTLERRTMMTTSSSTTTSSSVQQRFRPPTINLGTWSERPKSEITLKHDSDYRVGVGQLQARAAPIVRQAEPKPKPENLNLLGSGDQVTRSNSWRVTQQPPYKSSVTIHSLATEQVRNSNKPTVVLRQNPPASYIPQQQSFDNDYSTRPTPQKRYTTLVGLNGAPQPTLAASAAPTYPKPVVIAQVAPAPVVKGFHNNTAPREQVPVKISPLTAPKPVAVPPPPAPVPPPPPQKQEPMVIRPTAAPKRKPLQSSATEEDPRDVLMNAIRNFGGRSNLRRVRSTQ